MTADTTPPGCGELECLDGCDWPHAECTRKATVNRSVVVPPVETAVDTSAEAVERLAASVFINPDVISHAAAARAVATLRAVLAERDNYRAQLEKVTDVEYLTGLLEKIGVVDAESVKAERSHLVAEMTKRKLLPVLQEIDREWLAQSAAYAEVFGGGS